VFACDVLLPKIQSLENQIKYMVKISDFNILPVSLEHHNAT